MMFVGHFTFKQQAIPISRMDLLRTVATFRQKLQTKLAFLPSHIILTPGSGIMEDDDGQETTVFTVQPSFHHRHSTNRVS